MTKISPISGKLALVELKSFSQKIGNLKSRWMDERDHEDFGIYIDVAKKLVPRGWALTKMSKAFKLRMSRGSQVFDLTCNTGHTAIEQVAGPKVATEVDAQKLAATKRLLLSRYDKGCVVFPWQGQMRHITAPGQTFEAIRMYIVDKYPGAVILNELPLDEAVRRLASEL